MDQLEQPNQQRPKGHRVRASMRTLSVLRAVLDHSGSTVKQLVHALDAADAHISEPSLRDHLAALSETGWVRRTALGQYVPGPAMAAGDEAISDFYRLLDVLQQTRVGMSVHDLAAATGITVRAVSAAVSLGINVNCIARTGTGPGRYRLDADGMLALPRTASDTEIHAILDRFIQASGRDAALFTLSQQRGLVVSHVHPDPSGATRMHEISPGAAHATAGGQAVLTWLDDAQRTRYLETYDMARYTRHTITTMEALEAVLIREAGRIYSSAGQYTECCTCLAILVHNGPRTDSPIALTTSTRADTPDPDMRLLEAHLHRAAAALTSIIDGPLHSSIPGTQ